MRAYFLTAVAALALAGCQSAEERKAAETGEFEARNATMDEVSRLSKAARSKHEMQPGRWHTELQIVSADLSAIPEDKRDAQMEAIKRQERSATACRTADALKPLDLESLEKVAGTCVFPRYTMKGGKLDVEIQCGQGAARTVVTATGTMSQTAFDVTIDQTTGTSEAPNYLGLKLQAKGQRLGACEGKAAG